MEIRVLVHFIPNFVYSGVTCLPVNYKYSDAVPFVHSPVLTVFTAMCSVVYQKEISVREVPSLNLIE